MKQTAFVLFLLTLSVTLQAQYKKSGSAFGGRGVSQTFSFGASMFSSPGFYAQPPLSFHVTSGADKNESRWFQTATLRAHFCQLCKENPGLQMRAPKQKTDVLLTAKTTVAGMLDYDWGIYFNDAGENVRIRPFGMFGFGFQVAGFKDGSDNRQQLLNETQADFLYADLNEDLGYSGNIKAGIGLLYMVSKKMDSRHMPCTSMSPILKTFQAKR